MKVEKSEYIFMITKKDGARSEKEPNQPFTIYSGQRKARTMGEKEHFFASLFSPKSKICNL